MHSFTFSSLSMFRSKQQQGAADTGAKVSSCSYKHFSLVLAKITLQKDGSRSPAVLVSQLSIDSGAEEEGGVAVSRSTV